MSRSDSIPGAFGPTQTCYSRTVNSCPSAPNLTADIRVTDNPGTDGTIFFFNSQGGTSYWAPKLQYDDDPPNDPLPRHEHLLQVDLTTGTNDFRLVEIAYQGWWNKSAEGQEQGQGRLACRPATLVEWLIDRPNIHAAGTPVCGTGQSGGANQLAYMLTHYAMGSQFSGIVFTGGPLYSDLKWACGKGCDVGDVPDWPDTSEGCFTVVSRWGVDQGYGQADVPDIKDDPPDGCAGLQNDPPALEGCGELEFPGPCVSHVHEDPLNPDQAAVEALFEANSIAVDLNRWIYDYHDDLGLRFLFGDADGGPAVDQQSFFYQAVAHNVGVEEPAEVLNTVHRVPASSDGRTAILAALLETCVIVQP